MSGYIVKGNYLDPAGSPVRATQLPDPHDPGAAFIGGTAAGLAWCGRWIRAASDSLPFLHGSHGQKWDHGTTRHVAEPGDWVVWTGHEYRVVAADEFARDYAAVDYEVALAHPDTDPSP